jgi:hypothetical protein
MAPIHNPKTSWVHRFRPHNRLPVAATDTPADARGADGRPFARPDVPQIFSGGES